jgi:hypothetical protein
VKYWGIIANNLSNAGWSCGCFSHSVALDGVGNSPDNQIEVLE